MNVQIFDLSVFSEVSLSKLIVTTRDQIQAEDVDAKIRHLKKIYADADIRQMQIHPVDVSSSGIREAVKPDRIYQEPYQWQYAAILRNMGYIRRMKTLIKSLFNRQIIDADW